MNIVDTNRTFLVHYVSKYVEFNQAIDGVFEKHRRANIIMDSHSVIISCFFHEHLHITLTLPNHYFNFHLEKYCAMIFREIGNGSYFLTVRRRVS